MTQPASHSTRIFQTLGVVSPYLAVLLGVFLLKNGFLAVLVYHLVLLLCIVKIDGVKPFRLLLKGWNSVLGPLMCLGGVVPGVVILYLWPIARQEHADLAQLFALLNLDDRWFTAFAVYACLVNPFLEESFWRGCFNNRSWLPAPIDALFSGYHALVVIPVLSAPFVVLLFLAMLVVGWLLRTLRRLTGGLLIPLLTHLIADIAILYAVWKLI